MLYSRYPQGGLQWANVVEFQNIDFLSVHCWRSKGYVVHGHEVKVSRSDWQKELSKPHKANWGKALCDYWWLVAVRGVARNEEIPDGWGYIEVSPEGALQALIKAPRLRDALPRSAPSLHPITVQRQAFAMMARRYAFAQADRDHLLEAVDEPRPYLDEAARKTGRATSDVREFQAEFQRQKAMWRKEDKRIQAELAERYGNPYGD